MLRKLLAGLFCALMLQAISPAFAQTNIPSLAGSWEFTLTAAPGPLSSPAIEGLATFTTDGSVIETDTSEVVPIQPSAGGPVLRGTPGHGIWQPSPVFGQLFVSFTSLIVNPNATLRAKRILTMNLALNATRDQFSGGYSVEIVDPAGHALSTGTGTVKGLLMVHRQLP
ncbi:MAG: hypothetical protein JWO48_1833 [Bryobacterales bacterium]|nr:hypothetical protein [Bryobacterales bacterium]